MSISNTANHFWISFTRMTRFFERLSVSSLYSSLFGALGRSSSSLSMTALYFILIIVEYASWFDIHIIQEAIPNSSIPRSRKYPFRIIIFVIIKPKNKTAVISIKNLFTRKERFIKLSFISLYILYCSSIKCFSSIKKLPNRLI